MMSTLSVTQVRAITNPNLYNDYKHVRYFQNQTEQLNYFNTRTKVFESDSFNVIVDENGNYTINVPHSLEHLKNVSYVYFKNQLKWYFCFVVAKIYVQNNVTKLILKVDVFQTYIYDVTFKPSYIERKHTTLWETGNTPVINTIDEGLNYGTDYDVVSIEKLDFTQGLKWLVIVSKQAIHEDPESEDFTPFNKVMPTVIGNVAQPLSYYVVPFINGNTGIHISNLGIPISNPTDVLKAVYTYVNAVNNVTSIYVTEHCGLSYSYTEGSPSLTLFNNPTDVEVGSIRDFDSSGSVKTLHIKSLRSFDAKGIFIPNIYSGFKTVTESKLLMSPYTKIALTDMKGNIFEIKPEYLNDTSCWINLKGSLGLSNKVSYTIDSYNTPLTGQFPTEISEMNGIINVDANDLPIVADMLSAYLQGNRNTVANQKSQATFNTVMAGVSAVGGIVGGAVSRNPMAIGASVIGGVSNVGNGLYEIEAINAKIKDINNLPPNLTTQGSNLYYSYGNNHNGLYLIKYQIKDEYINTLTGFFKMFGYRVNSLENINLRTRTNYNYIKTQDVNLYGNLDSSIINELKNIFTNGVTIWHTNDIGNYNLVNGVI